MTVMVPSCMWIVVAWLALWLNRSSHHHLVFDQVQKLKKEVGKFINGAKNVTLV